MSKIFNWLRQKISAALPFIIAVIVIPALFIIAFVIIEWQTIQFPFDKALEELQKQQIISNLLRNYWLLFFAIFGGCLAIWARINGMQQLHLAREANRNDRFATATDMLRKNQVSSNPRDDDILAQGGIHILLDIIDENPKTEYIRSVQVICSWLLEPRPVELTKLAMSVFKKDLRKKAATSIDEYMKKNKTSYWAILSEVDMSGSDFSDCDFSYVDLTGISLRDVNFKNTNLAYANFQDAKLPETDFSGANLQGAVLERADLPSANMEKAKKLTAEQILSTTWKHQPPTLPEYIKNKSEVKKWLKSSNNNKKKSMPADMRKSGAREKFYFQYWWEFKDYLKSHGVKIKIPPRHTRRFFQNFPMGRTGFALRSIIKTRAKKISVELYITQNSDKFFDLLEKDKTKIEKEIKSELDWLKQETKRVSRIRIKMNADPNDINDWQKQFAWLKDNLEKFDKAFRERVQKL